MALGKRPPTLLEAWIADFKVTWRHHKIHVLPWRISACGAFGFLIASNIQPDFFFPRRWDVSVAVYAGFLAFNALTMALAWSGIARVYETLSVPKFASFLQHTGVLVHYHFILGFIHAVQTVAALISIVGLGVILIGWIPIYWDRIALGATIGATLYALWWAYMAAAVARDLSWHLATFDGLNDEEIRNIRLAVDNG